MALISYIDTSKKQMTANQEESKLQYKIGTAQKLPPTNCSINEGLLNVFIHLESEISKISYSKLGSF
jgi:hypothetical protein